jgi:MtrB/PioB family decaheme-associated outer membrane protein
MTIRSEILKARRAALLASAMSIAALPFSVAFAADQAPVLKAPPAEVVSWYFFGGFEAGWRFVDQPPTGFGPAPGPVFWLTPLTTDSRAKFWEYGEVRPGPFLDWLNLQTGTTDGRYAFDFWARNVGRDSQSYNLDASAIGLTYLSLGWDQTPHFISTSAKNIFGGVGTSFLTVSDPVQAALQGQLPNAAAATAAGATARSNIEAIINANLNPLFLGTQRDRASADWRWTPTDNVDVRVDYSHEDRTGVRPTGVPYGYTAAAAPGSAPVSSRPTNPVEIPQPVDDTTQAVAASGEYVGVTPWGTRWSTRAVYNGSFYDGNIKQVDIENPFCLTCTLFTGNINRGPNILRLGLPPSNDANAATWTGAVDLPFWKSRLVTTVQYNTMRQNDSFVDTGTNGLVMPPVTFGGIPVNGLDGRVDAFLWNNVYTAQITNDVKLTLRGRHYDIDNRTPSLHIDNWIFGDSGCAAGAPNPVTGACPLTSPRNSLPISYTKDNVSAEATWRAIRWLTFGGGVFWERYDRHFRDVNTTDEWSGKGFVDINPLDNVHARASYQYAQRRFDIYNTAEFVEEPGIQFSEVVENMRRFDVANRNRQKGEAMLEWMPAPFLTLSPNAGFLWDDYPDDVFNPLGVRSDHSWNVGIGVSTVVNSTFKLMASYQYEDRKLDVRGGSGGANFDTGNVLTGCSTSDVINPDNFLGTSCTWRSDVHQRYHTFTGAADWKVVPSRFDLRAEYVYSRGSEANTTTPCSAPNFIGTTSVGVNCNGLAALSPGVLVDPASVNFGQFPEERNTFQRFNLIGKYYVDPSIVRQMGWRGDVTLKLRYTWERNENTNWATDNMTPYIPTPDPPNPLVELTGGSRSLFLAAFNPNYTAQVIAAAVQVKW